jgi:hypothetical protein
MKQKHIGPVMKQKQVERDYGKDLLDTIVFLVLLLVTLWYFKV